MCGLSGLSRSHRLCLDCNCRAQLTWAGGCRLREPPNIANGTTEGAGPVADSDGELSQQQQVVHGSQEVCMNNCVVSGVRTGGPSRDRLGRMIVRRESGRGRWDGTE